VATQLALQRNAETKALIAQQGAQPKAQGAAQQNTGRRGKLLRLSSLFLHERTRQAGHAGVIIQVYRFQSVGR
jgi:hypothetical protein